jgi:transketolase
MLEQAYRIGYSHMPSALSALPIIMEIYEGFDFENDVFILSKGHGAYALYAVLEEGGFHPDWNHHEPQRDAENGVMATAGSLGHGLPVAAGIAYAKKLKREPGTVHVLLGDGEISEGTTWESMLFIAGFYLENIKIHIDCNGFQAISPTIYPQAVMGMVQWPYKCPKILRHYFRKGFGIPLFENRPDVHVKPISEKEYHQAMEGLV